MNALKALVFYMIKNTIQYQIPIQTWLKILKATIEPIALYGSEIWGPLKTRDGSNIQLVYLIIEYRLGCAIIF